MIVYLIKNKVNGKSYIGQTVQNLLVRWRQHLSENSCCRFLKNAIEKYGTENFELSVLAEAQSLDELNNLEERYIRELNTLAPNGYNLIQGGNNRKASEETKRKMSLTRKGRPATWLKGVKPWNTGIKRGPVTKEHAEAFVRGAQTANMKPIRCIENGKIYPSVRDCVAELGVSQGNVSQILRGIRKQTRGYSFEFVNPEDLHRSQKNKTKLSTK